ncbi:MAG: universal stress protein [Gammaproteobacteria bacterium]
MRRFKNILYLATTPAEDPLALQRAVDLAQRNRARLTLFAVHEPVHTNPLLDEGLKGLVERSIKAEQEELLAKLSALCAAADVRVETRSCLAKPFMAAIQAVQRDGFDLVVKAADGPLDALDRILGSDDLHLLRKCPCPVWIEPDHEDARRVGQHAAVLAAIDPSRAESRALDRTVLELASSLANLTGARLHVVHAWRLPGESMLANGRTAVSTEHLDNYLNETRANHRLAVAEMVEPFRARCPDLALHLHKGVPSAVILETARTLHCGLIVMGTVGRTGIPGLFIGNTAEEVLQGIDSAVLAIKPSGFESPIEAQDTRG